MNEKIERIKKEILKLAKMHAETTDDLDGLKDAEICEEEAENIIVKYCIEKGYLVNGFPTEKTKFEDEEEEEEYFCQERYRLYLDTLCIQKDDVAELMWFYNNSFWPDFKVSKKEFISFTKDFAEKGYDITL